MNHFGSRGRQIFRNCIVLWPLTVVLIYWLGDFNTYAKIEGREYVVARTTSVRRLVYSVSLGTAFAVASAAAVRAAGPNWLVRYMAIVVVFTVVIFMLADLNWYVVGHGPDGEDWIKNGPSGLNRLQECGILAALAGAVGCYFLGIAAVATGPLPEGERQCGPRVSRHRKIAAGLPGGSDSPPGKSGAN